MRWAVSLLLVSALLVQARPAGADASQEARTRFEKGTTLYDLGQYLDAAHEYEEAYKLRNSPPLLFNIGQAYRLAGEHAKALRAYRSYLRRVPDASNRAEVTGYIALCEKRASAEPAAKSADKPAPAEPATPPPSPRPAIAAPAPQPAPPPTAVTRHTPAEADLQLHAAPGSRPARTPVYKRWWLWTGVAVVVAAGVGLGLGLTLGQPKDIAIPGDAHPVQFQ